MTCDNIDGNNEKTAQCDGENGWVQNTGSQYTNQWCASGDCAVPYTTCCHRLRTHTHAHEKNTGQLAAPTIPHKSMCFRMAFPVAPLIVFRSLFVGCRQTFIVCLCGWSFVTPISLLAFCSLTPMSVCLSRRGDMLKCGV